MQYGSYVIVLVEIYDSLLFLTVENKFLFFIYLFGLVERSLTLNGFCCFII